MNEENNVEQTEAQKNAEVESKTQDDTTSEEKELTKEEIADLKKKAEVSSQNFERAKKAEKDLADLKKAGPKKEAVEEDTLNVSTKDILALNEAKISSEDYDEVIKLCKGFGLSISDGLKNKTIKGAIADRVEERETAQATQTKSSRGTSKVTGESLIEKARKGELPTTDEDIMKLAQAEQDAKLARLKR